MRALSVVEVHAKCTYILEEK